MPSHFPTHWWLCSIGTSETNFGQTRVKIQFFHSKKMLWEGHNHKGWSFCSSLYVVPLNNMNRSLQEKKGTATCHNEVIKYNLTHWPLGNFNKIYTCNFQTDFSDWWLRHLLWNCPRMNDTGLHWWLVNIGSGNGLVLSGNKPLSEPMLTHFSVAIWRHQATMS